MREDIDHSGIRPNGTVEGHYTETHWRPVKGVGIRDGMLIILIDAGPTDIEIRLPESVIAETHETLKAAREKARP